MPINKPTDLKINLNRISSTYCQFATRYSGLLGLDSGPQVTQESGRIRCPREGKALRKASEGIVWPSSCDSDTRSTCLSAQTDQPSDDGWDTKCSAEIRLENFPLVKEDILLYPRNQFDISLQQQGYSYARTPRYMCVQSPIVCLQTILWVLLFETW